MGCSHSTQRRTTRRRHPKRKRKVEENVESKEMRLKRQIAPTEPVFQADLALFTAAPDKNYRSEHIDLVKEQPKRQPPRTSFKQAVYTGIYNMRVHYADQFECRIRGAEFLPNGNLLVCDQPNQRLKLWSSTFQYLSHYDLPGAPHTICLHSSNRDGSDVYVTIPKDRTIQEFFVDGKHIIPGQKILTDGFCYGIAPYKYGLVVGVGTKIEFLDTDGHVIKTLQYAPGGTSKFGTPFHLAITEANNILVSDSYKGALLCITPEGDEIFKYDKITIPHGVTTDKEENLYICGNEKGAIDVLHQLTIRGQKVKSLLSWRHLGFTPDVVCFRQKDKLLAVCGEYDRIKTFRLDTKISGKIYPNDVIMDSERIQTERSTKEVQDIMKRILQS